MSLVQYLSEGDGNLFPMLLREPLSVPLQESNLLINISDAVPLSCRRSWEFLPLNKILVATDLSYC